MPNFHWKLESSEKMNVYIEYKIKSSYYEKI
jgi:hypothetical protein